MYLHFSGKDIKMKVSFFVIAALVALGCTNNKLPTVKKNPTLSPFDSLDIAKKTLDSSSDVLPESQDSFVLPPPSSAGGPNSLPAQQGTGSSVIPSVMPETSSQWTGTLKGSNITVSSPSGQSATLSQLQGDKKYLVLGFFNSNCPLCEFKADAFNQKSQQKLIGESTSCKYIAIVNGALDPWKGRSFFYNSYVAQIQGHEHDVSNSAFISTVFPEGFEFPTTLVIDSKGDIILNRHHDLGPQTALTYCR